MYTAKFSAAVIVYSCCGRITALFCPKGLKSADYELATTNPAAIQAGAIDTTAVMRTINEFAASMCITIDDIVMEKMRHLHCP